MSDFGPVFTCYARTPVASGWAGTRAGVGKRGCGDARDAEDQMPIAFDDLQPPCRAGAARFFSQARLDSCLSHRT
jgi:hypothetical protein